MVEMLIPHDGMPRSSHGWGVRHDGARRSAPFVEWSRSPARPPLAVSSALDRVRRAPTILAAMHIAPDVAQAVQVATDDGVGPARLLPPLLEAVADERDTLTAVAATHALGRVPGTAAEVELARLITAAVHGFDAHAVWAMDERRASADLVGPLAAAVARGGLVGMHAQRVLARWARDDAETVLGALDVALGDTAVESSRRYLAETVGLLPGRVARQVLERIGSDPSELASVRATAIDAFADRIRESLPSSFGPLARVDDRVGAAVRTVRARRLLTRRGARRQHHRASGLKVAQLHLAAALDSDASRAGMGDTGGLATLLPSLGVALLHQQRIHEVITISRSMPGQALSGVGYAPTVRAGHRFDSVPLEEGEGATFTGRWPGLVAAERGIRAALLASGLPDVIHLRMADPGSLVAATVARRLGIPTVFTLAPDPHGPIASAERMGKLDRRSFAAADARAALWFRARLVERLAGDAREVVLFPRPELRRQIRELVGVDVAAGAPRYTVVAEGVDTASPDSADATVAAGHEATVIRDLRGAIEQLPAQRHGLPIVVSIGRMHEIKGMARVVEAFAMEEGPAAAANLVIVGGDLDDPSSAEAAELARIRAVFHRYPGLDERVVLLGHRRHADAGLVLAVARHGWGDSIAPGGAYVCGSLKEEFGLAIVEAMAAGLPVVAPLAGGPATYVEAGVSGSLVNTADPAAIADGIAVALGLARDPHTAERTREVVDSRFTLDRMARTLAAVYRIAAGARTLALPVDPGLAV